MYSKSAHIGMRFDRCGERTPTCCSEWRRRASARSAYWRRFLAVSALRASRVRPARCSTSSALRLSRCRCCCSSRVARFLQTPPPRRHESTRDHFSTRRNFSVKRLHRSLNDCILHMSLKVQKVAFCANIRAIVNSTF